MAGARMRLDGEIPSIGRGIHTVRRDQPAVSLVCCQGLGMLRRIPQDVGPFKRTPKSKSMTTVNRNDTAQATSSADGKADWRGQHWLITGAAGSLGNVMAMEMARGGAILVLLDKNKRALDQLADRIEAAGGEAPFLFPMDLGGATPEDYQRFTEALAEHLGALDGIVHAAAHFDGLMPLDQIPALQWWVALQANLNAPLLLTRELLPLLRQREGHLVFLLDDLDRTATAFWGAYGVAQWGLHGMVRQLSAELSNRPIRVHGIVLPPFQSALRARAYPAEPPAELPAPELLAERLCKFLQSRQTNKIIYQFGELDA